MAAPLLVRGAAREYVGQVAGYPARVLCIGRTGRFEELFEMLIDRAEPSAPDGTRSLWSPTAIQRTPADLTAVEIHPWAAGRFRRAGFVILPQFVRWLGDPQHLPPANQSESLRSDLRRIAAVGYRPELVERPTRDEWQQFWREMVQPYLVRRFGGRAWIPSAPYIRRVTGRGFLLYVIQDGRRVAATGLLRQGDRLWIALMGIREGDPELIRQGAGAALYLFEIAHARETGIRQIDIGRTSPFLRDGIARYKRKFGYSPARDPLSPLMAIKIDPLHQGLNDALAENPVLVDDGTGLARFPA